MNKIIDLASIKTPLSSYYLIGQVSCDGTSDQLLVYSGDDVHWVKVNQINNHTNWQDTLEDIPIAEIERFLRRKKLDNISEIQIKSK